MAINNFDENISCSFCNNGILEKIVPVHSYDFNTEGYVPLSCNSCGVCSDYEEIIPETRVVLSRLSNHFIERVLKTVCNRGRAFSYNVYKSVKNRLVDRSIGDPYNLADLICLELKSFGVSIDFDYVIFIIYSKLGAGFSFHSFV